jgi:maltokinase
MNISSVISQLEPLLGQWLPSLRWFSSDNSSPVSVRVFEHDVLRDAEPKLLWTLVDTGESGTYQVLVGLRRPAELGGTLLGHDAATIGTLDIDGEEFVAYDALIDPTLSRVLFDVITNGTQTAKSVRPMGAEQSNTSLIFDSRLVLKVFRRLYPGDNPDLEVTRKLTEADFPNVAAVVAVWERGDWDLAVCQPYLWDGTEGWKLCLASVRDFLGQDTQGATSTAGSPTTRLDEKDPGEAGGDFSDEARRLGRVTGEMHVALAEQFPTSAFDPAVVADSLKSSVGSLDESFRDALESLIDEIRNVPASAAGLATRVHGDYHLGQTLRSVNGWYIFDFEGEPARPLAERTLPTSPLKDVTGMLRSFQYAAATGVFEQMPTDRDALASASTAWERRNRDAFCDGYFTTDGIERVLPTDEKTLDVLLRAFEAEKAIYELAYEKAYRPSWIHIPETALRRLLG